MYIIMARRIIIPSFLSLVYFVASSTSAIDSFHLWEPNEIVETLSAWKKQYPNLVKVSTSQQEYGLDQAGTSEDCPYDVHHSGCLNHFFTIQDYVAHPIGSNSAASLPEILWTGSMHGDQQFGPSVVMEAASILLNAAACEAKPNLEAKNWQQEIIEAQSCRSELRSQGIDDAYRQWLARLVVTRKIVVVPNPNALGQYRQTHLEGTVDPLEDFPYNNDESQSCMRTITARTMNEIFRDHVFQIALSFTEGEENKISYSWGSQLYSAPDHVTLHDIAESLSRTVGGEEVYPFAPSNSKILDLYFQNTDPKMAFQDWAYAASWENPRTKQCNPESFGGYDSSKTKYTAKSNRAVSLTVSSDVTMEDLGSMRDVFHAKDDVDNLDIARNMRLALVSADLVEPYVSIFGINSVSISEDVVPLTRNPENICDKSRIVTVPHSLKTVIVEWTVGGGLNIGDTDLWVVREEDIPDDSSACSEDNLYDSFGKIEESFKKYPTHRTNGKGFFSKTGPNPSPMDSVTKPFSILNSRHNSVTLIDTNSMGGHRNIIKNSNDDNYGTRSASLLGPVFRTEIDLRDYEVGDRLILVAGATVDQNWKESPVEYHQPSVPPQSHLANMRTNPNYKYTTKDGKEVEGRMRWFSIPVTVVVEDIDKLVGGIEMYKRFDPDNGYAKPVSRPISIFNSDNDNGDSSKNVVWVSLGVSIGFFLVAISCITFFILARRTRRRRKSRQVAIDGDGDGMFKTTPTDNSGLPITTYNVQEIKSSDMDMDVDDNGSLDDVDLHLARSQESVRWA